jgi:hypothetical protein
MFKLLEQIILYNPFSIKPYSKRDIKEEGASRNISPLTLPPDYNLELGIGALVLEDLKRLPYECS